MDRRQFLKGTAASLFAVPGLAAAVPEADEQPIIDTHQHLWDLSELRLPWLGDGSPLKRDFLMADYLKDAADIAPPARIAKTVYMEVHVHPEDLDKEADSVIATCESGDTPMVAAVIGARPASEGFARYVRRFKDNRYVKGVRYVLHSGETPAGYCLGGSFVAGMRLLGEMGLSFDLCMRPGELSDGAKLAALCPDTRFILDHCGNPPTTAKDLSAWERDLATLAERPNVDCKVSGIVASAGEDWEPADLAPVVNHVLEVFGPDRVVFGGDWPVCTRRSSLARWVDALRVVVADRRAEERKKLFHDNALRVYRLD